MSTQVDQQPQDDPRTEQAHAEPGSEDEAIAAFNQRRQSQAQADQDPPADDAEDGADDPDADPDDGDADPDDADPSDDLVEVTVDGETFEARPEVAAKIEKALLRQADYSRSMNALADTKKDYAQRVESIERREAGVEKLSKALAKVEAIDVQLEAFKNTDFDKLEIEQPQQAALLGLKLVRLQQAHANAIAAAKAVDGELEQERTKDHAAKQAEMLKTLDKSFPGGFTDKAGEAVSQYAIKAGWTPQEIRSFTDPRVVIALELARKYEASQSGVKEAIAKARKQGVPPVVKPGARQSSTDAVRNAEGRFQKSTSPEDAEALFEARAARRR